MDNALKAISTTDEELRVANYLALFGGIDLQGEHFTKGTDFESSYTATGRLLVDWEHGLDKVPDGDEIFGYVDWSTKALDERGLWVERVLDRRNKYVQWVEKLIRAGLIGSSTDSITKHVKTGDAGEILRWPLRRDTFTVMPMEPRMLTENQVSALKSLGVTIPSLEAEPQGGGEPPAPATVEEPKPPVKSTLIVMGETMSDEKQEPKETPESAIEVREDIGAVKASISELTALINQLLTHANDEPAIKNAGYITQDGGKADPQVNTFGDFLTAIYRGDHQRLKSVYGSQKAAMAEGAGATGGYLVPKEHLNRLLQASMEAAIVRPRATVIPVSSNSGEIPALDQATAPTAGVGQTAYAGGVRAYWAAEAAALTETEPAFKMIEWKIYKVGGYSLVANEMIEDSPQSVDALLSRIFGMAIAAVEDYAFLNGDGQGKPLGVLNAPCLIPVTTAANNTFARADAAAMLSRFQPLPGGSPVWAMHRGVIPDLEAQFGVRVGGVDLVQPREPFPQQIYSYPILYSEHLPQDDSSGDVILADFGAYLIFDRSELAIGYSPHYKFVNDQGTWKFTKRLDGQPWLKAAVTLADPTGSYTLSPFVKHHD